MDLIKESLRLTALSQNTRLQTIAIELSLAFTWCQVAKTECDLGEHQRFKGSMAKIDRAAASLRRRIEDPAHVPPGALADLLQTLNQLEVQIGKLKECGGS